MPKLKLEKALAVFDIEATGINPTTDRIVELSITRMEPNGERNAKTFLVNPGIPIPAAAAAIHGFTDDDVKDFPPFSEVADDILDYFGDADLGGFNLIRFDIPMLVEECVRSGRTFDMQNRHVVDVQRIFHRREPRDLTAALAFYCDEMHLNAHGAQADVDATIRVLLAQLERYGDLPETMEALDAYCNPYDPDSVDRAGRLKWIGGEVTINFGRKKGTPLKKLIEEDRGFIKWLLRSDFASDVKQIVENACEGKWPTPPKG